MKDADVNKALAGVAFTVVGAWLVHEAFREKRVPLAIRAVAAAGALLT